MVIKTLKSIDSDKILEVYNSLESNIQWSDYGYKGRQTGLQYKEGDDPWTSAVGKHQGDNETRYNLLNPYYKDTIFEEIIKEYDLVRTRLMWISPFACYSMHTDATKRIHIPLVTNPECYFVFKSGIVSHLPAGSIYSVDTRLDHTFMNSSEKPRLHLVGCFNLAKIS